MDLILSLAHWFGSAVCHQWPDHSYFIAGVELPLCARCTGMYLGGLLTLLYHGWRHPRGVGIPPVWALVAIVLFFLAWALDGVNSFVYTLSLIPTPYVPQNILRLTTGMLMGITLGTLIFIMFNSLVWREVRTEPILGSAREFLGLIALGALLVVAINSQWGPLLTPVSLASLVAILVLNGALMSAMVCSFVRQLADNWKQVRLRLVAGLAVALLYLDAIALFRFLLGRYLGYPI